MQAKYVALGSYTQANLISDLAAILCGAQVADLSATCDKANTTIVSTVAPGWTLVDANASNLGKVISAPDMNGNPKYVYIYASGTSQIAIRVYETWNSTTHTGTNPSGAYVLSNGTSFMVFGTPQTAYISGGADGFGVLEVSRDVAYLQNNTTYPATVAGGAYGFSSPTAMSMPRGKNMTAAGDTLPYPVQSATITARSSSSILAGTTARQDANGVQYIEVRPIWIALSDNTIIGRLYDIAEITRGGYTVFDTFSDGVDTWMVLPGYSGLMALKVK
jgi:hypothetical protein